MAQPEAECVQGEVSQEAQSQTRTVFPPQTAELGPGGVPVGAKTCDFYRVKDIPKRFNEPGKCFSEGNPVFSSMMDIEKTPGVVQSPDELLQGYSSKAVHPLYRTSNSSYGSRSPSVHNMPTVFCAKSQKFSEHLGKCGTYRNHSLNCAMDKSNVPDH